MLTVIAILWFLVWVFVAVDIVRRPQFTTAEEDRVGPRSC